MSSLDPLIKRANRKEILNGSFDLTPPRYHRASVKKKGKKLFPEREDEGQLFLKSSTKTGQKDRFMARGDNCLGFQRGTGKSVALYVDDFTAELGILETNEEQDSLHGGVRE